MSERLMYRPAEAADAIGVSRAKVYELIASGQIPAIRIGSGGGCIRVPVQALRNWIDGQLSRAGIEAGVGA
jgi:excisionase family DNA binding protein